MNLIPKIMKAKGLEVGSNGRVPAQQVQDPEFNPRYHQKKTERERKKKILNIEMISTKIFHMALISLSRRSILKQPK
jgi:hypothetical protein